MDTVQQTASFSLSLYIVVPIVVIVALLILGVIMARMYKRSTKELAFVRTGLGGELVVKDGGAIILPVVHETVSVNMRTLKLDVRRSDSDALITKDRMRVDVVAEFYIRVSPTTEGISTAAQTLGSSTLRPADLKALIEGKLVDVLRSVASNMDLNELHERRAEFSQSVLSEVKEDLNKNGLELENVALTGLDQTDPKYFSEDNMFDAEGLTKLKQITETKRQERNRIEQETAVNINQKNLEAEQQQLEITRQSRMTQIKQAKEIQESEAKQEAEVAQFRAQQTKLASLAQIEAERETQLKELDKEQELKARQIKIQLQLEQEELEKSRKLREASIINQRAIEVAEQDKRIAIAAKSEEQSAADALAATARQKAVEAEQSVITATQLAEAERTKQIEIIQAQKVAQVNATGLLVQAEADKQAATDRAESIRIEAAARATATIADAEAASKAELLRAAGAAETYRVQAEGEAKINEAKNLLSAEQTELLRRDLLLKALPAIMEASTKHLGNIDSIRLVDAGGFGSNSSSGTAGAESGGTSLADQLVSASLRHKAQSPLVDQLLADLGLSSTADLASLVKSVDNKQQLNG